MLRDRRAAQHGQRRRYVSRLNRAMPDFQRGDSFCSPMENAEQAMRPVEGSADAATAD
jgi:hypothetical protein